MSEYQVQLSPPLARIVEEAAVTYRCSVERAASTLIERSAATNMALSILKVENDDLKKVAGALVSYLHLAKASGVETVELSDLWDKFEEGLTKWL